MLRKNKPTRLKETQRQKQKLRMTIVIATTASLLVMTAGILIYLNFSQSKKSSAQTVSISNQRMLPVDFYQAKMIDKESDLKINGMRYKVPKQIPTGQTTAIKSIYGKTASN